MQRTISNTYRLLKRTINKQHNGQSTARDKAYHRLTSYETMKNSKQELEE